MYQRRQSTHYSVVGKAAHHGSMDYVGTSGIIAIIIIDRIRPNNRPIGQGRNPGVFSGLASHGCQFKDLQSMSGRLQYSKGHNLIFYSRQRAAGRHLKSATYLLEPANFPGSSELAKSPIFFSFAHMSCQ